MDMKSDSRLGGLFVAENAGISRSTHQCSHGNRIETGLMSFGGSHWSVLALRAAAMWIEVAE